MTDALNCATWYLLLNRSNIFLFFVLLCLDSWHTYYERLHQLEWKKIGDNFVYTSLMTSVRYTDTRELRFGYFNAQCIEDVIFFWTTLVVTYQWTADDNYHWPSVKQTANSLMLLLCVYSYVIKHITSVCCFIIIVACRV